MARVTREVVKLYQGLHLPEKKPREREREGDHNSPIQRKLVIKNVCT